MGRGRGAGAARSGDVDASIVVRLDHPRSVGAWAQCGNERARIGKQ